MIFYFFKPLIHIFLWIDLLRFSSFTNRALKAHIQGQLAMKQYLRRFPIQAHRKDAQP